MSHHSAIKVCFRVSRDAFSEPFEKAVNGQEDENDYRQRLSISERKMSAEQYEYRICV